MTTRTLTIVFTDIKGFTARTSSSSRAALHELLDQHENLLLPVIRHYDGTVVKTIGDAFLLTFESPTNAVLCGLMIQETLREFNEDTAEAQRIEVRVAINTGEVEVRGTDVFGDTVNIAARIEGITDPGEVYFTHATYLSMNKSEVPTSEVGERRLKGIDEPIRVYRVIRDESLERYQTLIAAERSQQLSHASVTNARLARGKVKTKRRGLWLAMALALVAVTAGLFGPQWYARFESHRELKVIEREISAADTTSESDLAYERLNDLAADNPDDVEILHRVALTNAAHPYWRKFSFAQIQSLVEHDPNWLNDEALADVMWQSLGYLDPDETEVDSHDAQLRAFIATNYAPAWQPRLLKLIHELEKDKRKERRNAYLVSEQSNFASTIDHLRYFTGELWGDVNSGAPWNSRVFDYFEDYLQKHRDETSASLWIPSESLPPYLSYFNDESDRVVEIVQGLFAEPLRGHLERVVREAETGPRLHSWRILEARGWDQPILERAYHSANLVDYWKGYTSQWVIDAIRYFAQQDGADIADTVIPQIQTIANETQAVINSGELPDARQSMDDYHTRLKAAEDALAALLNSKSE